MEELILNLRKVSEATLTSMDSSAAEEEEKEKMAGLGTFVSSAREKITTTQIRYYKCFLVLIKKLLIIFLKIISFRTFNSTIHAYQAMIDREFGQPFSDLVKVFKEKQVFDLCPFVEISLGEKNVKHWESLSLELEQNGRPCGPINGGRVPLDSNQDKLVLQLWKTRAAGLEKVLFGTVAIPVASVSTEAQKLPVKCEKHDQWIKIKAKVHNVGKEPAYKVLPQLIGKELNRLESKLFDQEKVPDETFKVTYHFNVLRSGQNDGKAFFLYQGTQYKDSYVSTEITDILQDHIELRSEADSPKQSKRYSGMNLISPSKAEKRKSGEVLIETVVSSLQSGKAD